MSKAIRQNVINKPFTYYGGKGPIAHKIIPLLPPHTEYVEPFCGSAAILFLKKPALIETINDMDGGVINFYRVLRDYRLYRKLIFLLNLTPYSRDEFSYCRDTWGEELDPVEKARKWLISSEMSFSANPDRHSFRKSVSSTRTGIAESTSKYLSRIRALPEFHLRLRTVQVENSDFRKILKTHDAPGTLAYCDPPYVLSLRNKNHKYLFEMDEVDHEDLITLLLHYRGMVVLSGYEHPLYSRLQANGWARTEIPHTCCAVGRTRGNGMQGKGMIKKHHSRLEIIWRNPAAMEAIKNSAPEGEK